MYIQYWILCYKLPENNIGDLVNCTIVKANSRRGTVNDSYLSFGNDTKASLKMALRVDGNLKYGQSTANNVFENMTGWLSYTHGEKEFWWKTLNYILYMDL